MNTERSPWGETEPEAPKTFILEDAFGSTHELTDIEEALKYFSNEEKLWEEAIPKSLPVRKHIIEKPSSVVGSLYNFLRFHPDAGDTDAISLNSDRLALDEHYRHARANLRAAGRHRIPFNSCGGTALLELCNTERNAAAEAFCQELYDRAQILHTHNDGIAQAQRITGREAAKMYIARAWTDASPEESLRTLNDLTETGKSLFGDLSRIKADAKELSKNLARELRGEASKEIMNLKNLVSSFKSDASTVLDETKISTESYRSDYADKVDARIKEIEKTVFEKTVLQQPTEFWRQRAKRLRNQGLGWSAALLATLGASAYGFLHYVSILAQHPNASPSGIHLFQSITGFIVAVGVVGYAMRVLGKLTLSAFHLQRDAEERAELTQFYLGLGIETEMSEESRNLALRALFSRSESGLLGTDSGGDLGALIDALKSQRSN